MCWSLSSIIYFIECLNTANFSFWFIVRLIHMDFFNLIFSLIDLSLIPFSLVVFICFCQFAVLTILRKFIFIFMFITKENFFWWLLNMWTYFEKIFLTKAFMSIFIIVNKLLTLFPGYQINYWQSKNRVGNNYGFKGVNFLLYYKLGLVFNGWSQELKIW